MKRCFWNTYRGLLIFCTALALTAEGVDDQSSQRRKIFEEVWQTVRDDFYDPRMNGVDWPGAKARYGALIDGVKTSEQFADVVNQMLAGLRTSHTHYYTPDDP